MVSWETSGVSQARQGQGQVQDESPVLRARQARDSLSLEFGVPGRGEEAAGAAAAPRQDEAKSQVTGETAPPGQAQDPRSGPSPQTGSSDPALGTPGATVRGQSIAGPHVLGRELGVRVQVHSRGLAPVPMSWFWCCPQPGTVTVATTGASLAVVHTSPPHLSGLVGGERGYLRLQNWVPSAISMPPAPARQAPGSSPCSKPQGWKSLFHAPVMGRRDKIGPAPAPATGATGLAGSKWSTGSRSG